MMNPSKSGFRLQMVGDRIQFLVSAPSRDVHLTTDGWHQVVLAWTRDDILNFLGTLMMLSGISAFERTSGFEGRETPPMVVPVIPAEGTNFKCRVVVMAKETVPNFGNAIMVVQLGPDRLFKLAERCLRRGGFSRVYLIQQQSIGWEDAPAEQEETDDHRFLL